MIKNKFIIATSDPVMLNFFSGQIQILKTKFCVEVVSNSKAGMSSFCKNEDVIGHVVRTRREISILSDIRSLLQFIALFFKEKPYVIHGNSPKAGLLSMMSGWVVRVPVRIYYIHGLRYQGDSGLKRKLLIMIESVACFFATDLFAAGLGVKETLIHDKITTKEINIINNGSINGVDLDYFSRHNLVGIENIRHAYGVKESDIIFGFVGRVVRDKGVNELVQSFLEINKSFTNTKLLLVGGYEQSLSPINDDIKLEIEKNKHIIHVGFQSDIRKFLNIMNFFVFPSYREGLGVSILEASAMELPIIATDIVGPNEIITHGYNGILVQPRSTEKLTHAMKALLLDDAVCKKISKNAREVVLDKYAQKDVWEKTLYAYCNLADCN